MWGFKTQWGNKEFFIRADSLCKGYKKRNFTLLGSSFEFQVSVMTIFSEPKTEVNVYGSKNEDYQNIMSSLRYDLRFYNFKLVLNSENFQTKQHMKIRRNEWNDVQILRRKACHSLLTGYIFNGKALWLLG